MRNKLSLLGIILSVVAALFATTIVSASQPDVVLEIIPESTQLGPKEESEVLLIFHNNTSSDVKDVELSWFLDNKGIGIDAETPRVDTLQSNSSLDWKVKITNQTNGSAAGNVYFQVNFLWRDSADSPYVPRVQHQTLSIQNRSPAEISEIVKVAIQSSISELHEDQEATIFLTVSNLASFPISVDRVEVIDKPDSVSLTPPTPNEVLLESQESRTFPIAMRTGDAVPTGKQVFLFETELAWVESGYNRTAVVTTLYDELSTKTIIGEQVFSTALGVPTFILLPGFLIVLTFRMLWERAYPKKIWQLKNTSPELWVISLWFSISIAFIYGPLTNRLTGEARNYLDGYGLIDIWLVFLISFVAGGLGYILTIAAMGIYGLGKLVVHRKQTPLPEDEPLDTLRKLVRNDMEIDLEQVQITGETGRYFIILERGANRWVSPKILMSPTNAATDEEKQRLFDLVNASDVDLKTLVSSIEQAWKRGKLVLEYDKSYSIDTPKEIAETQIAERLHVSTRLIELELE